MKRAMPLRELLETVFGHDVLVEDGLMRIRFSDHVLRLFGEVLYPQSVTFVSAE